MCPAQIDICLWNVIYVRPGLMNIACAMVFMCFRANYYLPVGYYFARPGGVRTEQVRQ